MGKACIIIAMILNATVDVSSSLTVCPFKCSYVEIGKQDGLKIRWKLFLIGSSPITSTNYDYICRSHDLLLYIEDLYAKSICGEAYMMAEVYASLD